VSQDELPKLILQTSTWLPQDSSGQTRLIGSFYLTHSRPRSVLPCATCISDMDDFPQKYCLTNSRASADRLGSLVTVGSLVTYTTGEGKFSSILVEAHARMQTQYILPTCPRVSGSDTADFVRCLLVYFFGIHSEMHQTLICSLVVLKVWHLQLQQPRVHVTYVRLLAENIAFERDNDAAKLIPVFA